jgi:hypothetical protein
MSDRLAQVLAVASGLDEGGGKVEGVGMGLMHPWVAGNFG